jgi:hypothetical protein
LAQQLESREGQLFIRRHWLPLAGAGVAAVAVVAWLAFGYFGVQYLFIDDEVNEAAPVAATATEEVGDFVDRSHPTSGQAVVLSDDVGERFLRFEDFRTDNGPDLNVYLSTAAPDAEAGAFDDDFVDLGDLKGNVGPQNYELPADVDLDRYSTVVIWCVRFGVAFGAAELSL